LVSALLAASCGGSSDRGRPIASLELLDFTVPGMFRQVSLQLGRPYLLELPAEDGDTTQRDLKLEDSDERAVMEELCRLDPTYQYRMDTPAWMLFPAGETAKSSPFGRRIATFTADGGVFAVLKQLVTQALPQDTQIVMSKTGQARPVKMQLEDVTVREVLAEIAAQGNLAFVIEPGSVRVSVVPE
jgi:hypothetical protein